MHVHSLGTVWSSMDNLKESILSYHVGIRDWTQAIRPGDKFLNPLSHLNGPATHFLA